MHLSTILALCAFAASIVLLTQKVWQIVAIIAIVAAGLEVALTFRLISFKLHGLPLSLLLGGTLIVCGVLLLTKAGRRMAVSAATVVAFTGVIQVLTALRIG
jgi:hypothetical protein